MTTKVAINGFGRIGRLVLRAYFENRNANKDIEIVGINDLSSTEMMAHLLKYDSVHGQFPFSVTSESDKLIVDGVAIPVTGNRNPEELPWGKLNVDVVYECTGFFCDHAGASKHLQAGAKRVLISAPGKNSDLTVVYGVNHKKISKEHVIISNASCTTNCLAPVVDSINKKIGIEHGFMTTVHAYTNDQNTVDSVHSDPRRARAAGVSMIPTSTGAAKAVGLVLPEMIGKLTGTAIRVPTPNVSMIDLTFVAKRNTSIEEINSTVKEAANGYLKGVLQVNEEPLVSIDMNHNPHSSIFDATQTDVLNNTFVRVLSWYDNEWGFSNRMLDVTKALAKTIYS